MSRLRASRPAGPCWSPPPAASAASSRRTAGGRAARRSSRPASSWRGAPARHDHRRRPARRAGRSGSRLAAARWPRSAWSSRPRLRRRRATADARPADRPRSRCREHDTARRPRPRRRDLPTYNEAGEHRAASSAGSAPPCPRPTSSSPTTTARRHRQARRRAGGDRRRRSTCCTAPARRAWARRTSPASAGRSTAGYDVLVEMDADGSHQPEQLPRLLAALRDADLVLGSRWVPGGSVVNWPLAPRGALARRQPLRPAGCSACRCATPPAATGCSARTTLRGDRPRRGRVARATASRSTSPGARSGPGSASSRCPIEFVERVRGDSKMSRRIVAEALLAGHGVGREGQGRQGPPRRPAQPAPGGRRVVT